jgi:hypothetical protein
MVPHTSNHKNLIAFTGGLTNRICISKKPQRQQCFWGFLFCKKAVNADTVGCERA